MPAGSSTTRLWTAGRYCSTSTSRRSSVIATMTAMPVTSGRVTYSQPPSSTKVRKRPFASTRGLSPVLSSGLAISVAVVRNHVDRGLLHLRVDQQLLHHRRAGDHRD